MWNSTDCRSMSVITFSEPPFSSITAIVVQVWTEDRSSSVCPAEASDTRASVSSAGQRLKAQSLLTLYRDAPRCNVYSALK